MEALTRLVSESLTRYGLDRPVDYRRLQWSRWFRCESLHSLLFVPSKPGVFAIAEEILDLGGGKNHVGTAAQACPERPRESRGGAEWGCPEERSSSNNPRRMLAVLQFGEDDDMAFVLDRMLSRENPMRARLLSGRCFLRYVVVAEEPQRRSICNALNQWLVSSGEKASGIGAHFASSLELNVARTTPPTHADAIQAPQAELDLGRAPETMAPEQRSSQPFPSGF